MSARRPPYVLLTLGKELRDTLRDRRTLVVMVLFPLVVYPLLALLGTQVLAARERAQNKRASVVAVEGQGPLAEELRGVLRGQPEVFALAGEGQREQVEAGQLDALVVLTPVAVDRARLEILFDTTRDESRRAEERLSAQLASLWPPGCAPRFEIERRNLALGTRLGGYVLSKGLPLMILLMVLLGAFYPAIDVTAGERERGTLETILAAPIPRLDLLLGKVLAVTILAAATGFLNLGSLSLTLVHVARLADATASLPIPWSRAAAVGLVVLPMAFLLASFFVAVGALARGFKEAQNLLMPIYFALVAPALIGALGDFRLGGLVALVPGVNLTLLARDIALGNAGLGATALVLGSTLVYGTLALVAAARLYASERFLTAGEDGSGKVPGKARGDGGGRGGTPRQDPPTAGEALALFAVGYLLLSFVFIPLQRRDLVLGLLVSQWLGLLGLVLLFSVLTRRSLGPSLVIRLPAPAAVLGSLLMGGAGWVVANLVSLWLFPPPREFLEELRRTLFPAEGRSLLFTLFLFAVTPAVCEEVFFRGAVLRGLLRRIAPAPAVLLCGLLFGLFHIDLWRLLPTAFLGVMLSWIAWRGGSLLLSVLAHFVNNAVVLILGSVKIDQRLESLRAAGQIGLLVGALVLLAAGAWLLTRSTPRSS
jgi:sodium transport system permease protein